MATLEFLDWMNQVEAKRTLTSPSTYGVAPPKRKKAVKKPNRQIDDFVKELDLLKKDLDSLHKTRSKARSEIPKEVDDDELLRLAKVAMSNLKITPKYYTVRLSDIGGKETDGPKRKVSKEEARRVARTIGLEFSQVEFTPELFRRALESEVSRAQKDSRFELSRQQKDNDEPTEGPTSHSNSEGRLLHGRGIPGAGEVEGPKHPGGRLPGKR